MCTIIMMRINKKDAEKLIQNIIHLQKIVEFLKYVFLTVLGLNTMQFKCELFI